MTPSKGSISYDRKERSDAGVPNPANRRTSKRFEIAKREMLRSMEADQQRLARGRERARKKKDEQS